VSRPAIVECAGAPRDIGLDQGRACRALLRARFRSLPWWEQLSLRTARSDPATLRASRDMLRHFPHQAEALEGMARGAGVPRAWLAQRLAREHAADSASAGCEGVGAGDPGKRLLARSVTGDVIVRRIRPDGGFGSLELVRPWLTSGLAGVNEEGLALLCAQVGDEPGDCAAPAVLMARDCLQQFDSVGAALEWCTGRPAGGRATLLLADASGELAAVEVAGPARRVRRADAGLLVAAPPDRSAAIEKSLRAAPSVSPETLVQSLTASTEVDACVLVDPEQRRLGLAAAGEDPTWFPVRAPH
jgi:hypothetical protein